MTALSPNVFPKVPSSDTMQLSIVGWFFGTLSVGALEEPSVGGLIVGAIVVGAIVVGTLVGPLVGAIVGDRVGALVGLLVNRIVGTVEGFIEKGTCGP